LSLSFESKVLWFEKKDLVPERKTPDVSTKDLLEIKSGLFVLKVGLGLKAKAPFQNKRVLEEETKTLFQGRRSRPSKRKVLRMLKGVLFLERRVLFLFFQVLGRNQKALFQNKRVLRSKKKVLSSKSETLFPRGPANRLKFDDVPSKRRVVGSRSMSASLLPVALDRARCRVRDSARITDSAH
jgi:hypothetical protein